MDVELFFLNIKNDRNWVDFNETKSGPEMIRSDIKYGDQTTVWTGIEALVLSRGPVFQKICKK